MIIFTETHFYAFKKSIETISVVREALNLSELSFLLNLIPTVLIIKAQINYM